ncbi:hypothetical protein WN48_07499 [Eufriesea mexicana]|uniref:Uncharacterized protein n=1 Tax=Eufriesea mexicana TaxID=516756 RepID=A0A310SHF2_9HYME|nr:PREDICTED: serine-rich adhesin for platelets-like [Eufriesea mexicana]OAD62107.1 hypothetical protein WN48_07499 [Eufriesea mexicana]
MLNNDGRTLGIIEVKPPSALSSSADRSINGDEEIVGRTESSSGGSSPSDLKKRLQHHPSRNEATRLANRVINISRRLSRNRDFYLHGATSRIEENVEKEEREEQETVSSKKSHSDFKAKDARARRRAKIRSDHDKERMMVISKPSETGTSDLRNETSNSQRSNRSSLIERKIEEVSEESSDLRLPLGVEILSNNAERYSSLSARSPSTFGLYRNQDEATNDSSRSQRNYLRIYSDTSCEDSSKARIDLQPTSPASVKSSSHNRYRACRGVILQNLSSGSEAESNCEVMSDRIAPDENTERSATIRAEQTNIPSGLCANDSTIRNLNNTPAISLSSRRSSNHTLCNSSRSNLEDIVASPVPRVDFTEKKFCQSLNSPLTPASLSSARKITRERSFYRILDSSRSDCTHNAKSTLKQLVEEPLFFSDREGIRDCNRKDSESSSSLLATPPCSVISPRILDTRISKNVSHRNVINLKRNAHNEDIFDHQEREIPTNEYSYSSNSIVRENQSFASTPTGIRLPETIPESPTFECSPSNNSDPCLSNTANTNALKEAISKCILNYDGNNDMKITQLRSFTSALQFQTCPSENRSAASTFRESFIGDSTKSVEENLYSSESSRNDEEARDQHSKNIISDKEFVHVPTLVLNSREVSYSSSPASKPCSEKRLDADTLIMALSNAALKQQATKENSENTCSESCIDSKTFSRPGSSENDLTMDTRLGSRSIKSDENQSKAATPRTCCRSSLSTRSRIPVKIRSDRSRPSVSKLNETETRVISRAISPTAETHRFGSDRSSNVPKSDGSAQFMKNHTTTDVGVHAEVMLGFAIADTNSKEHERYCDRKSIDVESENVNMSDLLMKDVQSRTSLSFQMEIDYDGGKEEAEIKNGDASCANRLTEGTDTSSSTSRSSNRSSNWKKSERSKEQNSLNQSSSSESESENCSRCCDMREAVARSGEHEQREKLDSFRSRISRTSRTSVGGYRSKRENNSYEGEILEETTEERKNLLENQIGDGGYQDISMEDSHKLQLQRASSPEDDESVRGKRAMENRDKLRFSLEKLAADQFRRNISLEQAKTIQSDTATFFAEKFYEIPQFSLACSSSASKLRRDKSRDSPRVKKKSQDRFPFTISEKTSIASMKFKVPGRLGNFDEDEEDRSYRLDMHPSITRLAGSGFEDSPAEIISYVARTELEDRYVKSSGMKGLVQKFSARWKKPKKHDDRTESSAKATNVIYENRDYREECESSMESCSESSLLREFKVYRSFEEKTSKAALNSDSPDEKSSIICSKDARNGESWKNTWSTNMENPCRRYDRDDMWVQAFKDLDSDRDEGTKDVETSKEMDESKSKDPYSVFFVKSTREAPETSARPFLQKDEKRRHVPAEKQKNRVKFRGTSLVVTPKRSDETVCKESIRNRGSERVRKNRKNMQSGCFCLRFYRMIVPISFTSIFKYRSRINNSSSIKKRPRISLQKKKG